MATSSKKSGESNDFSVEEKIVALYELRKIDSKIDEINKIKGELPLEVQDLEDEIAGLETRMANITSEGMVAAAVTLSIIPIVALYPFVARFMVQGITIGSVKG